VTYRYLGYAVKERLGSDFLVPHVTLKKTLQFFAPECLTSFLRLKEKALKINPKTEAIVNEDEMARFILESTLLSLAEQFLYMFTYFCPSIN
jgi:hypothetical protein